jgi:hypothetical protein
MIETFFFYCGDCKQVWLTVGPELIIFSRLQQFQTVKEVPVDVSCREDKVVVGRVASVAWVLWNSRNNYVWNIAKYVGQQLGVKAICMWRE